jgi:hypothetical protein
MHPYITKLRRSSLALAIGASLVLSGCKSESTPENQSGANLSPSTESAKTDGAPVPALLAVNDQTWTPEAMEDLLAPVALYPDEILGEVLVAATNPQEVLDAGNWRLKNEQLEGKALDDAAKAAGFTPPVRMVLQNPTALDMMCSEFGWTQELGQAFVNDQEGVLAAVQRLRRQAKDAGSLTSSDKMVVDTETVGTEQAIVLSSPDPEVVYVPQYDPETAYAPATETEDDDDGIGTGTAVAVAALAFGAGLALSQVFDDDDDDWYDDDYYYPSYYGSPMPYYSHYPYQPAYGGYYASTAYVRPANYRYAYNNTTVVRTGGADYWNRYDDRSNVRRDGRNYTSPITKARGNRPELQYLNEKAKREPNRRAPNVAEERGRYQEKKRETATRAEQRGRGKGQRQVADVDREGRAGEGAASREGRGQPDGAGGDGRDRDRTKAGGGGGRDDRVRQGGGGGGGNKAGGGDRRGGGGDKAGGGRSGGGGKKAGGGGGNKGGGSKGGGNKGGGGRKRG